MSVGIITGYFDPHLHLTKVAENDRIRKPVRLSARLPTGRRLVARAMGVAAVLLCAAASVACSGGLDRVGEWIDPADVEAVDDAPEADEGPIEDDVEAPEDENVAELDGPTVTVERVIDGDSLEVRAGSDIVELRLEGYNAPELYTDDPDGGADRLTCNGTASKDAVEALLDRAAGPLVLLERDQDRFGRTLGDLIIDGRRVSTTLVSEGEGLATGESRSQREAMKAAADARLGVWSGRCGGAGTVGLQIGDHQVDPPGNDRFNLEDEWVEVINESDGAVSLDGWVLRDDTTGHQFPLSGSLGSRARLTIRTGGEPGAEPTGGGVDGESRTLYLGESFPVWSNAGETIILVDPNGSFVDWRFVDPS